MLAQRRSQWPSITSALGQCIVLSGVSGAGMLKLYQHNAAVRKTVQSANAVSMTGQRRRLWVNIETSLFQYHVFVQSIQQTGDRLVLGSVVDD